MHDNDLYPIGDAARRSGLSVSAIRFYSDAGVIAPTRLTGAGYRLYDLHAIARLEFVRTLRELDVGLEEIRRVLGGESTLHDLLTAHLEIVERQERGLRAKGAVLRTLVRQEGTAAQVTLLRTLVSMSDEEREQLIDGFWNEVGADLDVPVGFVEQLRQLRPRLPQDPSAAQLQAWVELADLVQDREFRDAVRAYLQFTYTTEPGRHFAAAPVQEFMYETGVPVMEDILDLQRSGAPVESPRAQEAIARLVRASAALGAEQGPGERERMASYFTAIIALLDEEGAVQDTWFDSTHGRYVSLVAVINGTPPVEEEDERQLLAWMVAALRASVPEG
ncbi:MerR family transcriptional regulator [Nocardiopsis sp. L17-MgMaSL7]|uniref:MerR family transcriptional regulator n=1 Tax=Nocardiopsis sp. L17-MgMaSL7 TaxID=1938893 RepID=UPI000D70E1B7|nr:MerR family transcriptional regulator [Nocardiopsis sp. L17-MgMaSL7]PWV45064.1 DNA-binding transcriptional MerR regulator [Nocardiopsis sp. L17-MgMaSL7]